jgi:hypothetical protein
MEAIWLYKLEEWGLKQANRKIDELSVTCIKLNPSTLSRGVHGFNQLLYKIKTMLLNLWSCRLEAD